MDPQKPKWPDIRKHLLQFETKDLIALLKELHDLSQENRSFLQARFPESGDQAQAILEDYKEKITMMFFVKSDIPKESPRLKDARKLIMSFRKATGSFTASLDLMLHYVETGAKFTRRFGDIDEPFYNSLESVLSDFSRDVFKTPDPEQTYQFFDNRLVALKRASHGIGWGFGDSVSEILGDLEAQFMKDE